MGRESQASPSTPQKMSEQVEIYFGLPAPTLFFLFFTGNKSLVTCTWNIFSENKYSRGRPIVSHTVFVHFLLYLTIFYCFTTSRCRYTESLYLPLILFTEECILGCVPLFLFHMTIGLALCLLVTYIWWWLPFFIFYFPIFIKDDYI